MKQPKDGVKPRTFTMDAWEATFLSWPITTQENALSTLASLHKHCKRGRLGSQQPAATAPATPQPATPGPTAAAPGPLFAEGKTTA
jgi:hypothetical protein